MTAARLLRVAGRTVHEAGLTLVVLFMVAPTIIVILFSSEEFIRFPSTRFFPIYTRFFPI